MLAQIAKDVEVVSLPAGVHVDGVFVLIGPKTKGTGSRGLQDEGEHVQQG
jgi:hypothetical protein